MFVILAMQVVAFPITIKAEADFVILSGEDLISGESSGMKNEYVAYDYEQKKTYTRFEPEVGTEDARPVITQKSTGVNFGEYDYYVISYFSSQTTAIAMPMAFVVNQNSLQAAYPDKTIARILAAQPSPASSNGEWKTATYARTSFYHKSYTDVFITSEVTDQKWRFQPWDNIVAEEGAYFGIEYIALFKTEQAAQDFVAKTAAGVPVETLNLTCNGEQVTSVTVDKGSSIDIAAEVAPFGSFKNVSVQSSNTNTVDIVNGKLLAKNGGTATLTFTANEGIAGANVITKTVTVTVNGDEFDGNEVVIIADGATEYSIVYEADIVGAIKPELDNIQNEIRYGALGVMSIVTVPDTENETPDAVAKEIVIGNTNRPGSEELAKSVIKGEYIIKYDPESTRIFIVGGTVDDTITAINYFFDTYIDEENAKLSIPESLNYTVEAEFAIISGEDLISGESSGMMNEYVVYDFEQNKTYTRFEPITGTTDARPVITQKSTGVNFGKYEYYVISYFSSQTTKNAMPMAFVVDQNSLQAAYPDKTVIRNLASQPNAASSNGEWKTATYARTSFYHKTYPDIFLTPTVTDQKWRFQPWYNLAAEEGAYFGIEYIALFKTEKAAQDFVTKTTAGVPVEDLKITFNGDQVTSVTVYKDTYIDLATEVSPYGSFKNVAVKSSDESVVDVIDGRIYAVGEGSATLTFTANEALSSATKITKTVNVTVNGYRFDSIEIDGVSLENYKIVIPDNSNLYTKYAAEILSNYILKNLNKKLEIVTDSTSTSTYEILIGNTNRAESNTGVSLDENEYVLMINGKKIVMSENGVYTTQSIAAFINNYLEVNSGKNVNFTTLPTTATKKTAPGFAEKADNFIVIIGDGMGDNHINMALANGLETFVARDFPVYARHITRHQSVLDGTGSATDSSAAATAMATGYKSQGARIGQDIYGNNVQNITELMYDHGADIAVVTTDKITGATPAGFLVHNDSRLDADEIMADIEALAARGFLDYYRGKAGVDLTLRSKEALEKVTENGSNFFVMIEESATDAHTNDAEAVIAAVTRLDDATAYASQFIHLYPNTAIIVTADHETGGIVPDETNSYKYKFTATSHTNRNVPLYAFGAGVEALANGPIENIEIARFMAKSYTDEHFGQTEEVPIQNAGDVNADGKINHLDLVILSRYLADWEDYDLSIQAEYCNLDRKAKITTIDVSILARCLAKWTGYEKLPILP